MLPEADRIEEFSKYGAKIGTTRNPMNFADLLLFCSAFKWVFCITFSIHLSQIAPLRGAQISEGVIYFIERYDPSHGP
jgi:hypothetical protein